MFTLAHPFKSSDSLLLPRAREATGSMLSDNLRPCSTMPPFMLGKAEGVDFITPGQWKHMPDAAYGLLGMLAWFGSGSREDVATLTLALSVMREVLKRRPAEFGGPMEVR